MKLLMIKKKEGTPWFLKRRSGCVYIHAAAASLLLRQEANPRGWCSLSYGHQMCCGAPT